MLKLLLLNKVISYKMTVSVSFLCVCWQFYSDVLQKGHDNETGLSMACTVMNEATRVSVLRPPLYV